MTLWTIQTKEFWDKAQKIGVLKTDRRYAIREFRKPYEWMRQQMIKRIGPSSNGILWAWNRYIDGDHRRPDLRRKGHLLSGAEGVLIEFEISENSVLLSDFENWHFPLNNWYLGKDPVVEREIGVIKNKADYPEEIQDIIDESWQKIFNVKRNRPTQATLWGLHLCYVTKITEFISK